MQEDRKDKLLTLPEAAALVGKHPQTIRRWIYSGHVPAKKVGKYGRFIIREQDLMDALEYDPPADKGGPTAEE